MPFVDARGARRRVGGRAEAASRHPVLEGDARGAAQQRVLDDRCVRAVEEDPGRLAVAFAQDFDVVGRPRVRPDARELESPGVGDADERPVHPPAPRHADVHRVVRRYGVEVVAGGEPSFCELVGAVDIVELRGAQRHEHRPLAGRGAARPRGALLRRCPSPSGVRRGRSRRGPSVPRGPCGRGSRRSRGTPSRLRGR